MSTAKRGRFEDVESSDDDTSKKNESGNNLSTSDFESDEETISIIDIKEITEEKERSDSESINNSREIDTNFRWED
ncbi:hypothetical protein AVEN_78528-1 [Araneus ventricosus]|uniref:Uncharacterized protein n=1 Tax=Araneus ventricosus TaxID=182803 RepID=A0A4Y2EQD0_ARAVE|nr:hypothetical protein AVEN_78528-1 [Araneus ventricosus]